MPFVTNSGSFPTMPYPANERFVMLAHPSLPDTLLLQQMTDSGDGYSPPGLAGTQQASGRTVSASLVVTRAAVAKLEWRDMAFVCSDAQVKLLEQLVQTQSAAVPCTVLDNMLPLAPVTKLVAVQLADKYKTPYAGLNQFLVQFAMQEV